MTSSLVSRCFFIGLLSFFIYVCAIGVKNIYRYNVFSQEYKMLKEGYRLAQRESRALKQQLIQLDQDDFLETEIKMKLGYIKPGEVVYYFPKKVYK